MPTRRSLFAAAATGALILALPVVAADNNRPVTKVLPDAATPPGAAVMSANQALSGAISRRETGVYRATMADFGGGANVETLVVLENGTIIDMHSRRGGTYLTRTVTRGIRANNAAAFGRLIALSAVGRPVSAASRASFLAIANGGSGNSGGNGGTSPSTRPTTCPADYAGMSPASRRRADADPRYSACLSALPGRSGIGIAANAISTVFGIPAAEAARWTMLYFKVVPDNLWSSWGVVYDAQAETFSFNVFGVAAGWQTGG